MTPIKSGRRFDNSNKDIFAKQGFRELRYDLPPVPLQLYELIRTEILLLSYIQGRVFRDIRKCTQQIPG